MKRWRRFHELNAKKPADLRAFFWKRFDPKTWSLHVVTYRNQDALFAPFQVREASICDYLLELLTTD